MTIKEKLLSLNVVKDNKYLDEYCKLIESNKNTKREKFKTQKHHIIPRYYYRINNIDLDNSKENVVNLLYKDHFVAHLLLAMCSNSDLYCYNNFIALSYMSKKVTIKNLDYLQSEYEQCRERCESYNPMYNDIHKKHHDEVMRKKETRDKISSTMKRKVQERSLFTKEHRKNLTESMKNSVYVYNDLKITRIKPNELDKYLKDGWKLYEKRTYEQKCGKEMMTKLEHNFSMFQTRNVSCYCIIDSGERFDFKSIRDATIWWFEKYHPFGEHYSECVLQRKIKKSIKGEKITHGNSNHKDYKEITNIKWYK